MKSMAVLLKIVTIFLKHPIYKFAITYSKIKAKNEIAFRNQVKDFRTECKPSK